MEKFENIETLIESARVEAEKFYQKGNKTAGTRLRKLMQDLKNAAQEVRVEVQETKANL